MKIADLLAIPYIRGSESVPDAGSAARTDAGWTRRFRYAELPNCTVDSLSTLDGLLELERLRVAVVLDLLVRGEPVPRPRPPLRTADLAGDLRLLGIELAPELLDLDESAARGNPQLAAAVLGLPARP